MVVAIIVLAEFFPHFIPPPRFRRPQGGGDKVHKRLYTLRFLTQR
jgi:hypothetical protein